MAVLTTTDYLSIMTDYAAALTSLEGIEDYYYNAAYTVLLTNIFDPEIDLLVSFHNAYVVSQGAYASAPATAIAAVNALQNHILSKSLSLGTVDPDTLGLTYDDINDYYADYPAEFPTGVSAVIPATFATMSAQAGHSIDSTYVIS